MGKKTDMKICLISVEIFAWGKHGGFGRATRVIGRELVKRGHEVYALVPRRQDQKRVELLDGIKVYGFSPWWPFGAKTMLQEIDADIFHSCEPSYMTYLAMQALPDKKHMVTFRDPRNSEDWKLEFERPSLSKLQVIHNYWFENNPKVRQCIKDMDAVYTIGKYLVPKVKSMYDLARDPEFLPTPVVVPTNNKKASSPTVCYVARLDRRKRPELFLDLVAKFPDVNFILMGKSRDQAYERQLQSICDPLANLKVMGFVDQFSSDTHSEVLEKSWILVNTATREALPNSFIEATSRGCAILSAVNPDGFASEFGYHAAEDDFEAGLKYLIDNNNWYELGKKAYRYTLESFEINHAMDLHEEKYAKLLGRK